MTPQALPPLQALLALCLVIFHSIGARADADYGVHLAADPRASTFVGSSTVYLENRGVASQKTERSPMAADMDLSSPAIEDHAIRVSVELEPVDAVNTFPQKTACVRCASEPQADEVLQDFTHQSAEDGPDNHVERFGYVSEMTVAPMAARQRQGTSSRISRLADELETLPGRGEAFSVTVEPYKVNWNLQAPSIPQLLQSGQGRSLPRIGLTPAVSKP